MRNLGGNALAVESQCEKYLIYTDPVMDSDLSIEEYNKAKDIVLEIKDETIDRVQEISCEACAREAAANRGLSFAETWEVIQ